MFSGENVTLKDDRLELNTHFLEAKLLWLDIITEN